MAVRSPGSYSSTRSEALNEASPLERMGAVGARDLAAQPRRGEHLARVRQAARVERGPQPRHRGEIRFAEEQRHRARLVGADAVLAGDRAARVDAGLEDLLRELVRSLGLAGDTMVV